MLASKIVEIVWTRPMKNYYISKGYIFTEYGDCFNVNIEDLKTSSSVKIEISCDYCGGNFSCDYNRYNRLKAREIIHKDACRKCGNTKKQESSILKYGNKSNKYTNEEIIKKFEDVGLKIINIEDYENSYTKLECFCEKHPENIIETTLGTISQNKRGCKHCYYDYRRTSYDEVFKAFEERGLILLTSESEYINSRQKIKYLCKKHPDHIQEITYKSFNQCKKGCRYCRTDNQTGENSWLWKGGISPITIYLRERMHNWKKESMKNCNFKCVITGKNFDDIHHLYSFNLILEEVFSNTNITIKDKINKYTEKELEKLTLECERLHFKYGLGVCLTKEIHDEFHKLYGYGNNTPEQFEEYAEFKKGDKTC